MINMLHFLFFMLLGVCVYLNSNRIFHYSIHPLVSFRGVEIVSSAPFFVFIPGNRSLKDAPVFLGGGCYE